MDARRSQAARLPGEITTIQYLEIPDRRFQFKATAGAIPLYDASDGSLQAEVAYVAYVKSEAEPVRPITFVFLVVTNRRSEASLSRAQAAAACSVGSSAGVAHAATAMTSDKAAVVTKARRAREIGFMGYSARQGLG